MSKQIIKCDICFDMYPTDELEIEKSKINKIEYRVCDSCDLTEINNNEEIERTMGKEEDDDIGYENYLIENELFKHLDDDDDDFDYRENLTLQSDINIFESFEQNIKYPEYNW